MPQMDVVQGYTGVSTDMHQGLYMLHEPTSVERILIRRSGTVCDFDPRSVLRCIVVDVEV